MNKKKEGDKKKTESVKIGKIRNIRISPWIAGGIIGFLAASLQYIASMTNPPAYGFCMACHGRDLINSIINTVAGEKALGVAGVIDNPVFIPPLTIIGVLLGAFVASKIYKEFRITKAGSIPNMLKMFILGMLVMISALILSACPIRTSLRVAHGDLIAVIGLLFIGVGAIIGTILLERSVKV